MNDLLGWMRKQNGGAHTYLEFQKRLQTIRLRDQESAAMARLLADLAERFVDAYDGEPLPAGIASQAYDRLLAYVERAVTLEAAGAAERIACLTELGSAELAPRLPAEA